MSASLSCPGQSIFDEAESSVRSYARCFPAVFRTAKDSRLVDVSGQSYIDFFMGAGSLNYGHNPDRLKGALVAYVAADGITHGLDMMTEAKGAFIEAFRDRILRPRGLAYRFLFPGPAGATAVEAAVKLARKATGRRRIAAFTNGFHGMTLGALAATGSRAKRAGAGVSLDDVDRYVYDGYFGEGVDTIGMIDRLLCDPSSGIEPPAAILVETVQGEGGLRAASATWLRALAALARRHGSLLIVDDIQAGCGRTGRFFSFDEAGFVPDIVCLSKSLSGYGLPLAMLLVRPEIDVFEPGEHNGTFRGFNWAFVTGRSALAYWDDEAFAAGLSQRIAEFDAWLARMARSLPGASVRGRGMMRGLAFADAAVARAVAAASFERGVVIETSGGRDDVLKFLPALTITRADLAEGLERVEAALRAVCAGPGIAVEAAA